MSCKAVAYERFHEMRYCNSTLKNKKFTTNSRRDVSKGKFLRIHAKQWAIPLKTFLFSGSSGLGKSRFAKRRALAPTSLTREYHQFILPNGKMERHMISLTIYKAQDAHLFDIDATSFDSRSSKRFDKWTTSQRFLHDSQ